MNIFSFQGLKVYKDSKDLVKDVYKLLEHFPSKENYAICDQLRRAVVSIPSNIAEGSGRKSYKEKIHFLEIAFGSLMEVVCQIEVSNDLGYISEEDMISIEQKAYVIGKEISGLTNSFRSKLECS